MKQTWKLITSRGTTWKVIQVGDNNPKKKTRFPALCHTSCTSWISEPITLKVGRHVPRQQSRQIPYLLDVSIYAGGHPRGHQHRANPLSYITFHRSHVGESTKHDGKWMQFFARQPHNILDTFIQRRSANSKQDAKEDAKMRMTMAFFPPPFKERRLAWTSPQLQARDLRFFIVDPKTPGLKWKALKDCLNSSKSFQTPPPGPEPWVQNESPICHNNMYNFKLGLATFILDPILDPSALQSLKNIQNLHPNKQLSQRSS